jgi:ubiquinone/menaquinone biosynthesis C-methylase UbiE
VLSTAPIDLIRKHLVCTECKGTLDFGHDKYSCPACQRQYVLEDNVFCAKLRSSQHYFDSKHEVMQVGNTSPEIMTLCYSNQSRIAAELIREGDVVVDIGCGPTVHYERPAGAVLIGLDPSFDSLRVNSKLDLRVFGGAENMPFADKSVDRIFLFYSIHHMIGKTVEENTANLTAALRECRRVVRDQGSLVIFDMSPWWPAWQAQRMAWNRARNALQDKLDMFFWRASALEQLAGPILSARDYSTQSFSVSPLLTFPPVFSLPNLRVPRFMYPFDIKMYKWSF